MPGRRTVVRTKGRIYSLGFGDGRSLKLEGARPGEAGLDAWLTLIVPALREGDAIFVVRDGQMVEIEAIHRAQQYRIRVEDAMTIDRIDVRV
jgi:hypothetical protein